MSKLLNAVACIAFLLHDGVTWLAEQVGEAFKESLTVIAFLMFLGALFEILSWVTQ